MSTGGGNGGLFCSRGARHIAFCVALVAGILPTRAAPLSPAAPGVSFDQRIGEQLPLDATFHDEAGTPVQLGTYFDHQPIVLVFGYSRCPQLCAVVSNAAVQMLRSLRLTAGRDYTVVYVSIDPTDSARDLAALKRRDTGRYGRHGTASGWHYLSGSESNIRRLTDAAGFHFTYDARSKLYAHASGFCVVTPGGRIAQYFLGIDYAPKDVAFALERAAAGKTGSTVYNLVLLCARGLGITGRYGRLIWITLEIAVLLTVLVVFGGIAWMLRQERKSPPPNPTAGPQGGTDAGLSPRQAPGGAFHSVAAIFAFGFRDWLPARASTLAPRVDLIFWSLVAVSAVLVFGLAASNLYFLIRYRRGSLAPRPPVKVRTAYVETAWITATTVVFLAFFFWGAHIYLAEERPPAGGLALAVTARQWMWDVRHENGRREFNELHVPLGQNVRLTMTSEDVIHSFFVPAFRLKQDVVPGKQVTAWFQATQTGTFHLFCAEYCGTVHSGMIGDVIVMPPERYAEWLSRGNAMEDLAQRGRRLFLRYNCSGCHDQPAAVHAPPLAGVYGTLVPTRDGRMVRADEAYVRDSILQPQKDIVAGYEPLMPSFQNVIPESDILDLISYVKSLAEPNADPRSRSPQP